MTRQRAIRLAAAAAIALAWPAVAAADVLPGPAPTPRPTPAATTPVRPDPPTDPGPALPSGEVTVASAALVVLVGAGILALAVVRQHSKRDSENPDA